jgi:general secretion pathway protein C
MSLEPLTTVHLLLKRHFWIIPVIVVAMCGLLAANIVSNLVEAQAYDGKTPHRAHAASAHARVAKTTARVKDADAVVARNMFCSTCEPEATPLPPGPTGPDVEANVPATSLPLALVGTIIVTHGADSSATIANTQSHHSGSYAVKDRIPEAGEIVWIGPQGVHFKNATTGRVERIDLVVAAAPTPPAGGPAASSAVRRADAQPPATPPGPEAEMLALVDKGVHKVDETHYTLDRAMVDKLLLDPTTLARSVRIQPQIADNKTTGWKMAALRPTSPLTKIGMMSGDTITAINGFDLSTPDKVLEVYAKVRSAQNLSISVVRNNQPVDMEYAIR